MKTGAFRAALSLLSCGLVLFPLFCHAGPVNIPGFYGPVIAPPPRTAMPVLQPSGTAQGVSGFENPSQNRLIIHQNQPNAIIDWSSFNIGADAQTHFDQQKNPGWVALNRIYDRNPSLIFGRLTADGKVYLINQNGILFGPGSKVDVNSLTASALNIRNSDFMNGVLNFYVDPGLDYPGLTFDPRAAVSNLGEINAAPGGAVFLFGPRVENAGIINAPVGQVGLAAGTQVGLAADPSGQRTALIVEVKDGFGGAWNREGGQLISDTGMVGMYGRVVNQDGLIRSVTAVKQNGQIELRATEKISTGSNSIIQSPISDSSETVDNSFTFSGGNVFIGGLQTIGGDANGRQSIITNSPPALIEHRGSINAPSGQVSMNAGTRVFLDTGSRINVGGAWSNEAATANVVEAQLNSVELRDAYGQKGGPLRSRTITAYALTGSSIGDISGAILSTQKTALEKSIQGGTISVTVDTGDTIVKQGATLDFSGGGIRYSGGALDTTKLLSGTNIYDIGNAPLSIQYDKIMGQYNKTYGRFGITESYSGIYYGGASPLKSVTSSFTRGGDAGSLQLSAGIVVLDGHLNGSVTRGLFQTNRTLSGSYATTNDYQTALQLSQARGLEVPTAGTLTIDLSSNAVSETAVRPDTTPLPADFSSDSLLTGQQTVISAKTMNAAALGSLNLYAKKKITTDGNARIVLSPGGSFSARSSRIEHSGDISVPAGTIALETYATASNGEIFLAPGSRLDVAGEKVDNSMAGKIAGASISSGQIQGGTITVLDRTNSGLGVFIPPGATLDVSGGYQIDAKGKITGGNAGLLEIRGSNLMLSGDIMGYALADSRGKIKGGRIVLHADVIEVTGSPSAWPADFTAGSPVPAGLRGLVMAGDRFSDAGFTQIELDSVNNISVDPSAEVVTSLVKLQIPALGVMQGVNMPLSVPVAGVKAVSGRKDLIKLDSQMAYETGPSSFSATAGKLFPWQDISTMSPNDSAALTVSPGAVISMAPEGKIALSATGGVTMSGILESPSGQIGITAGPRGASDLVIKDSGRILVNGYNRPDMSSTVPHFRDNYSPRDGGQVTLQASGDMALQKGSLIDVSGSDVVENRVLSGGKVTTYSEASNPGGLSLIYFGNLTWDGGVNAKAKMAGVQGGILTISHTGTNNGMYVKAEDVTRYLAAGFDDLTLKSGNSLDFSGAMEATVGRKLTLDAPGISGAGQDAIVLRSPWITLANTTNLPANGPATSGSGQLTLSSTGWLDLDGQINMSGFTEVRLEASRDIRLTSQLYTQSLPITLAGHLTTPGDLVLKADRIYPTILSNYNLQSTGGKVTILPADNPVGGSIFSAGGNLTVEAQNGIEVRGTLAAPMGTITLKGTGPGSRVYLSEGSSVTTAGNAMVNYGEIDNNGAWVLQDQASGVYNPVNTVPGKSVTIDAPEIIIRNGATVDVSGGGYLFAYQFQPGIEGSVNPLTKNQRYVIMSDRSVQLPGDAVYLTGGAGLAAGIYSILPAQYAFLPGSVVIEARNLNVTAGQNAVTNDGYPVVAGYSTVIGTGIQSRRPKAYAVMTASDVLSQGYFTIKSQTTGDAGNVTIKGDTAVIDGQVRAAALDGYQGGKISLSARDILVQQTVLPLPAGFDFKTSFDSTAELQGLKDKLSVSANSLYGTGFQGIDLGDPTVTNSVTIRGGSVLEAPVISLAANKIITVEDGAQLQAVAQSGPGAISLNSPVGTAVIQAGALLHASHAVNLNVGNPDIQGTVRVDHSSLTLKGAEISFVPDGYARTTGTGLYITDSLWRSYSAIEEIKLVSGSDLLFLDDFKLSATGSISIDAARIAGVKSGGAVVSLTAPTIHLFNSGAASTALVPTNAGQITFAGDNITVGGGDVLLSGFKAVNLNSQNDFTLKGSGSLKTGGADLHITAARVTTTFDQNKTTPYIAANFQIDAGSGAIGFYNSGGAPGTSSVPGGMLEVSARKIDLSGAVEMSAGAVKMTASGFGEGGGIFLHSGGQIFARGNDLATGGRVTLRTDKGSLVMEPGSSVDVSAGAQGDAGAVTLQSPVGGVSLGGKLRGTAQGGVGGSLVLDTKQLSEADMTGLIGALAAGGFTGSLDIRARTGDLGIVTGQTLKARYVKLSADDQSYGRINLSGTIDAGGSAGGGVELYATNDLNIQSGGRISAAASTAGSSGGTVLLSSAKGWVNVNAGGMVDLSGGTAGAAGGTAYLRAQRNGNDVKVNMNGAIAGAAAIYAEAVKTYSYTTPALSANTQYTTWLSEAAGYYGSNTAVNRLNGAAPAGASSFHLLPGIEVVNSGVINMDAASGWDLTNTRYGSANEPGVLTLRAGGDLNINKSILDHPTPMNYLQANAGMNSWAINLTAGADTAGADYLAVVRGQGNLTIKDQSLVYTESAPIRFASGNDTLIGTGVKPAYMINSFLGYNLASYGGSVRGNAGRDLSISGGAVQTATGKIDIDVGRDLLLNQSANTLGAIRTTGQNPSRPSKYWNYAGGGNIILDVGRNVGSKAADGGYVTALSSQAWDQPYGSRQPYIWAASYTQSASYSPTAGLATMGGGDLVVRTGGEFLSQAGTFGQGDLIIHSGGDIRGRFLNKQGRAEIHTMGNFGAVGAEQVIEAFDNRINVSAQGNIELGAVANPTIANDKFAGQYWNLTYTENTSVSLKARGDVTITGNSQFYNLPAYLAEHERILPATVDIEAGGNIHLMNSFALAPAPQGNLRLIAGNDIGGSYIYVSDMNPANVYTALKYTGSGTFGDNLFNPYVHGNVPLHGADTNAVEINAGGDIKNLKLFLPKKAEITAGRDIRDLYYFGQNVNAGDVSKIRAGGNIIFDYVPNNTYTGLTQAGPGILILRAGNSIDLGNSNGIQSIGNQYNPVLGMQGSSINVLSGYAKDMTLAEAGAFFDELRAEAKSADSYAQSSLKARRDIIPVLGPPSGSGDINMTVSQISTNYGKSDIFIFANGALNVGKSTFFSNESKLQKTGILTSEGGAINIFAKGDINVNESRVMTFFGGDITVWSDQGNINAGRGSKTAINATAHSIVFDQGLGRWVPKFVPPAVGSGIRAVTYDPDGEAGPLQAPPPGDIYPHAKVIDAGEAGLYGGNIFLQAQQVLNVANIGSSIGSVVGMPQAAAGTANIGNMSGAGTVTAGTAQLSQETAGVSPSNAARASQMIEDIIAKWLNVEVIDFVQGE